MLASDIPGQRFSIPFANSASGTYKAVIPTASQIGVNPGRASLTDGFVPLNFTPVASGGIPPFGKDMNGILYEISGWSRWQQAGGPIVHDATFSAAIGGYPAGAILSSDPAGFLWRSTVDNNVTDPDAGGAGWSRLIPVAASNAQAAAGVATDVWLNPANLAFVLAQVPAGALYAQNGYLPIFGLLLQWGRFNITGGGANLTVGFPVAFPTACWACVVAGGNSTTAQDNQITLVGNSITASNFVARFVATGTSVGTFIAIGN